MHPIESADTEEAHDNAHVSPDAYTAAREDWVRPR